MLPTEGSIPVADLAKVMELYQNDLSDAASIWSS